MESCQVTVNNNNTKIQFHNVRNVYPFGEMVNCLFTVPTQYKPEVGDWIGIYPVGWSNMASFLCKKMIRPENVWSTACGQQHWGKIEFEMNEIAERFNKMPICGGEPTYQFVYVKNGGEYVHGMSSPFTFGTSMTIKEETVCGVPSFGGLTTGSFSGCGNGSFYLEQEVEKEMQRLQSGIYGIEQGLILGGYGKSGNGIYYPTGNNTTTTTVIEETTTNGSSPRPFGGEFTKMVAGEMMLNQLVQPHHLRKHWMTRVSEVEQMLLEQFKIEQAQRRVEQLNVLAQLKSYERHIFQIIKSEQSINEHLRGARFAAKVAEFEQKCYQIVKVQQLQQQPEYYVRKYEQLLKEKIELDIVKRVAMMNKLRQLVKECIEIRLREVQTMEHQHFARFAQLVKSKIGSWETKFYQPTIYQFFGGAMPTQSFLYEEKIEQELKQQFKYLIGQLYNEQRKELYQLVKLNKQLCWLCQEMSGKLVELELCHGSEIYSQLRIPKIQPIVAIASALNGGFTGLVHPTTTTGLFGGVEQHIVQLTELEQLLSQVRGSLRARMLFGYQKPRSVLLAAESQWTNGIWMRPIVQKLKELEWTLRQEKTTMVEQAMYEMPVRQQWVERRLLNIVQHIRFFEQMHQIQKFEECKLKEVIMQLRELEGELCEIYQPSVYPCIGGKFQQQIVELGQFLHSLIREKIGQISPIYEQWSPIECYIQSGCHGVWKQLQQLERKLVLLKGIWLEKQLKSYFWSRLAELEQFSGSTTTRRSYSDKIRYLKNMLEQHYQLPSVGIYCPLRHYLFVAPERFIQHHERVEKLWTLFNEFECQYPTTTTTWMNNGEEVVLSSGKPVAAAMMMNTTGPVYQTIYSVHKQFNTLVQEFQQRIFSHQPQLPIPEMVAHKIFSIGQFLKSIVIEECLKVQSGKPLFYVAKQLKEKLYEFEALLCLEQIAEQQSLPIVGSWWCQTPMGIQHYIKQIVARQVRLIKSQLEEVIVAGGIPSSFGCVSGECSCPVESLISEEMNNNTILPSFEHGLFRNSKSLSDLESIVLGTTSSSWTSLYPTSWSRFTTSPVEQCIEKQFEQTTTTTTSVPAVLPTGIYTSTTITGNNKTSPVVVNVVEGVIGELESELVKLRLQKESFPLLGCGNNNTTLPLFGNYTTTTPFYPTMFEQIICDEIVNGGRNNTLLTTASPVYYPSTSVKVGQQQQQHTTTTTTVYNVEPQQQSFVGGQCVKVQQRESVDLF